MGLFDQGKLEKMTIRVVDAPATARTPPVPSDDPADTYVVQVNPKSYSLNYLLNYTDRHGQGDSSRAAIFANSQPTTLEFDFLFDATGVVPPPSELGDVPLVGAIASALAGGGEYDVRDEISKFLDVVYTYDGTIHRPHQVLLIWGTLEFACVLSSVNFQFTLFKPDGTPLRAVAKARFLQAETAAQRALRENNSSPDLTHLREVREGDSLPLLAYRVYGDAAFYLEVARVNKLVNFRRLEAGRRLTLPPVAKGAG